MSGNVAAVIWLVAFFVLMALGAYYVNRLRKPTLRELCRREYGDEFVKNYDTLNEGGTIGGLVETVTFINMVEAVKDKHKGQWR